MLALDTLTAEQRLEKAVIDITAHPRYVALVGVIMIGTKRICETTKTAYTNGMDEVYGRTFVDSLTDAELRFLVLHETYHKLYKHLITWRWMWKLDSRCANQSCDHVINLQILDENRDGFAKMPTCKETGEVIGCADTRFSGMDSAQVFKILREEPQDEEDGDGNGSGDGAGMDEHDWENAEEMTAEEEDALARDIDSAIRQGGMAASKSGMAGGNATIDELMKVKVDWREVVREFAMQLVAGKDFSTYAKPNRRYISSGIYMPSGLTYQMRELCVAQDTSGSVGQRMRTQFISEIKAVCDMVTPELLRVLYWGSSVVGDETYGTKGKHPLESLLTQTKIVDGGGTCPAVVPQYMKEKGIKPDAVIILTDGDVWGGWGEWDCPILWCIADNPTAKPPVGKCVHINTRAL